MAAPTATSEEAEAADEFRFWAEEARRTAGRTISGKTLVSFEKTVEELPANRSLGEPVRAAGQ